MSAALRPAYSLQRPTKRRRTATSVLAGDFDPRPRRDCFTDMANSHNQPCSSSSVLAHGSPVFWDLPQNRRTVARSARAVHVPIDQRAPDLKSHMLVQVVEGLPYDPLHPNSPRLPENRPESQPDSLFLPQPASGTAPQRLHQSPLQSPRTPPAALSSAQHAPWSPDYRSPLLQWNQAPSPLEISTGSQVSNSPRPSSLHPNSPPTPSRSISSYSSRTSSKRPRTPDDDELIPGSTPLRPNQSGSFQLYDDGRRPTLFSDSLASPFSGPRENPSPPKSLAWYSPPADAMQAELPAQPRDTSPFSLDRSPPAHRRHALSVAALLSPSMGARLPPPPAPSTQPPESREATPPPITEPEPEIVLSYPSPSPSEDIDMDMDMDMSEDLAAPAEDSGDAENNSPPEHADLGNNNIPTPSADPTPEPERDLLPDANKSRASKAMRIIQSEDELTDLEHAAAASTSPFKSRAPASLAVTPAPGRVRGKRTATRRGWKGWVEVEVDEEEEQKQKEAGRQRGGSAAAVEMLPWASLRERRTRSGRQFDA